MCGRPQQKPFLAQHPQSLLAGFPAGVWGPIQQLQHQETQVTEQNTAGTVEAELLEVRDEAVAIRLQRTVFTADAAVDGEGRTLEFDEDTAVEAFTVPLPGSVYADAVATPVEEILADIFSAAELPAVDAEPLPSLSLPSPTETAMELAAARDMVAVEATPHEQHRIPPSRELYSEMGPDVDGTRRTPVTAREPQQHREERIQRYPRPGAELRAAGQTVLEDAAWRDAAAVGELAAGTGNRSAVQVVTEEFDAADTEYGLRRRLSIQVEEGGTLEEVVQQTAMYAAVDITVEEEEFNIRGEDGEIYTRTAPKLYVDGMDEDAMEYLVDGEIPSTNPRDTYIEAGETVDIVEADVFAEEDAYCSVDQLAALSTADRPLPGYEADGAVTPAAGTAG